MVLASWYFISKIEFEFHDNGKIIVTGIIVPISFTRKLIVLVAKTAALEGALKARTQFRFCSATSRSCVNYCRLSASVLSEKCFANTFCEELSKYSSAKHIWHIEKVLNNQ